MKAMITRQRRLRSSEAMRSLVRETRLSVDELIYPIFVAEGENIKNPIDSMPGIYQYSIDRIDEELDRVVESGVKWVLIFGIPVHKDEVGSEAYNKEGITQRAIRHIKEHAPGLMVVADVCLCEYTSHGHCGLIKDGEILNDETLPLLAKAAVTLADAGADIIAPSDMMDGRVAAIRAALDESGHINTPIMSYSTKFASAYYSPFRDAAHSAPQFGDRKIKPALAFLDVVKEVSWNVDIPLAAYNVSGEYSMVKAAAANGWIDEKRIVMENMTAIKRAGADIIITYHALDVAKWLKDE